MFSWNIYVDYVFDIDHRRIKVIISYLKKVAN